MDYQTCRRCGSYWVACVEPTDEFDEDDEQVLLFLGRVCQHCDFPCDVPSCQACYALRFWSN